MDARRSKALPEVFRPRRLFAAAMAVAGLIWVGVFVYLLQFHEVPTRTFLSTGFFIALFAISVVYYGRTAIFVDARGITYRGLVRTQRLPFGDILKVDVLPGPVTVYAVRGKGIGIHFTSFFSHHRRLVELLVQRAGLAPIRV